MPQSISWKIKKNSITKFSTHSTSISQSFFLRTNSLISRKRLWLQLLRTYARQNYVNVIYSVAVLESRDNLGKSQEFFVWQENSQLAYSKVSINLTKLDVRYRFLGARKIPEVLSVSKLNRFRVFGEEICTKKTTVLFAVSQ